MRIRTATSTFLTLLLSTAVAASSSAKDWGLVTLADMPEYIVAGTPLKVSFSVRQNGQALRSGLHPQLRATTESGLSAKANAVAGNSPGEYTASVNLPQPGEWTIVIAGGLGDSTLKLPVLKVIAPGSTVPVAFSPATRGVRLFASKGCVSCHRHVEVNPERTGDPQLDLSGKRFPPDELRKFLADPSRKAGDMPNLQLKSNEIDALIGFIDKLVYKTRGQEEQ
jgi:hypothetical protein